MSEVTNPLFEDQREFLERQKEEYKNALLNDVAEIKDQSQKIGKNLAIAGGLLAGIYLVSKAFSGRKAKKEKKKSKRLNSGPKFKGLQSHAWTPAFPQEVEDDEPLYSSIERTYPAVYYTDGSTSHLLPQAPRRESAFKTFLQSDVVKMIEQQLAAALMVYLTRKLEQYLQLPAPGTATAEEPETTDIEYHLHTDEEVHAQPQQL